MKLQSCPSGYEVSPAGLHTLTAATAQQQQCRPCEKGYECVTASCVTCTACAPGYYKAAVSTEPCVPCPANSYVGAEGSTSLNLCQVCPAKSSTKGLTGRVTLHDCSCDEEYYLVSINGAVTCSTCPKGAICRNNECALRNAGLTCVDSTKIVGTWVQNNVSFEFDLTSCPEGYELKSTSEQGSRDLQQCFKCLSPSSYILQPDLDVCQPCPPGLTCAGDATFSPVIAGSVWVKNGSFVKLQSCPSGYEVSPAGLHTLTAATAQQQQCRPCEKGYECVTASCVTCTACAPGYYKAGGGLGCIDKQRMNMFSCRMCSLDNVFSCTRVY